MNYFKKFSVEDNREYNDLIKFAIKQAQIPASMVKIEKGNIRFLDKTDTSNDVKDKETTIGDIIGQGEISSSKEPPKTKEEALLRLTVVITKILVGFIINKYANLALSKIAIREMKKTTNNKYIMNFIYKQIDSVYRKHKNYTPCNAKKFMKSSMFNYMCAEFRDKRAKEIAKYIGGLSIQNAIKIVSADVFPFKGSIVLALPIKIAFGYCGVYMSGGSIYDLLAEVKDNVIGFGITYRPGAFVMNNLTVYSFKDGDKMVATHVQDPPEKYFKITVEEAKEILRKFGNDIGLTGLKSVKEEVKKINDLN